MADSAFLRFPGLQVRIRSTNAEFLRQVGLLFALNESSQADVEYSLCTVAEQLVLAAAKQELYRGDSVEQALIALYGDLYSRLVASSSHFLVHAGSAVCDGEAVVLPGAQESGKSTLSVVLASHGWRVVSDDVASIDTVHHTVHPYPRRLLIRPETLVRNPGVRGAVELLRMLDTYGEVVHVARPIEPAPRTPVHVRAFVFPRWSDKTQLSALTPGATAARLMDNSLNLCVLGDCGVRWAAHIARHIPGFSLAVSEPSAAARLIRELRVS